MVECNICGWTGPEFAPLRSPGQENDDPNVFCPSCGSYERHRALACYLCRTGILPARGRALEIGNGIILAYRRFLESQGLSYVSLDLWPGFGDVTGDLVTAPFAAGSLDLVICSHVLEHVSDDFRALEEVARILAPKGLAVFQIPYDDRRFGTVEHGQAPSRPIGSGYHYGHARDYGLDVLDRFRHFWPQTCEIDPLRWIRDGSDRRLGFDKNYGTVFFCSNSPEPLDLPGRLNRDLLAMKRRWMIERRAHQISLNGSRGGALDDWLMAEKEIGSLSDNQVGERNVFEILRGSADGRRHRVAVANNGLICVERG